MRQGHAKEHHSDFRERNSAKWDNTSEAWGHYAQWISQSEKTLVPLIWGMWNEKVKFLWYQRVERWLQRLETEGKGKLLRDKQEVSVKWDEQTLGFAVQHWSNSQQSWIMIIWCHLQDTWDIATPTNLFTKHRITDVENRFVVIKGVGEGQIRSWGLTDTNCYISDKQQGSTV